MFRTPSYLLFQPSAFGNLTPKGGAVSIIRAITPFARRQEIICSWDSASNFVANIGASPAVTLGSGAAISTNVPLISADRSISGSVLDASNSAVRLPGVLLPVQTQSGLLAVGFADTNGNYTVGVTSAKWKVQPSDSGVAFHGYVQPQDKLQVDCTTGSVSGVNIALPRASALFYGSITVAGSQPLSAIDVFSSDHNNSYGQNTSSDLNGSYFAGALSGTPWAVGLGNDTPTNYVFSEPTFGFSGTNLNTGQALLYNFIALPASQHISGHVQLSTGQPIPGVPVFANAIIGTNFYATQIDTDANGDYFLGVGNFGNWSISVSCQGGDDSLDVILGGGNYQCPSTQIVTITNNNGVANFIVILAGQPVLSQPTFLASGQIGFYLSGAVGSNYTIRASTNVTTPSSTWPVFLITNLVVSPAFILDGHATNQQRFFRAFLGP